MALVSRSQRVKLPDVKPATTLWLNLIQNRPENLCYRYCAAQVNIYNAAMPTTLEILEKTPESLIAAGVVNARRVVLVGDAVDRAKFTNRLKAIAIDTIGY